jgi:RNA polymerase sigma-70 factor, ECF subfamily
MGLPDLAEIYAAHAEFVWRSLMHLGVPSAALEDAVQDVFLVIHRRREDLEDRGTMRGLLFGVARRVARKHRPRERPRRLSLVPREEPPTPDDAVARAQAATLVQQFLAALDEDKRTVFTLVDVEGMPVPEVAELLGIKLNTAYSRLRLARRGLQEWIRRPPTAASEDRP